jgi:hypothetical protein
MVVKLEDPLGFKSLVIYSVWIVTLRFNAAVIDTSQDLTVAIFSPLSSIRVQDCPVFSTVLNSIANNSQRNELSRYVVAGDRLENSTFIVEEIFTKLELLGYQWPFFFDIF